MLPWKKHSLSAFRRETSPGPARDGWGLAILAPMKDHSRYTASDAEYESRVRESFVRQGLMKHLGAELVQLEPGHVEIRVPFRLELTQQHNYFHAGVSGAIADSACGYAAYTLMPAESSVLTVEYKMNLLAPADGEELIARANVLRSGRTLKICIADVYVRKDRAEVHCATMLSTIMCLPGKSDRPPLKASRVSSSGV
jgi:uncharacterized protein (TIGR00369 family)